jgi:aryl-alcohol dehydrogenase-like predicted oxidoreductase
MNFGTRTPRDEALGIVERALEMGIRHIDTANIYGQGESERVVGEALRGRRETFEVATKVGLGKRGGKPEGLSRASIVSSLDESLQRLGTEYVDLLYLHAPDPSTPLSETLEALSSLLEQGKIKAWGVSNFAAWQILELQQLSTAAKLPAPRISQVLYNLLVRQLDVEYFAFARKHPIHTTVYNPLAGGLLAAGKVTPGSRLDKNPIYKRRYASDTFVALAKRYAEIASQEGISLLEMSYAWLCSVPGVDSILVGPATVGHLNDALHATKRSLSAEGLLRIEQTHRNFVGTEATYTR